MTGNEILLYQVVVPLLIGLTVGVLGGVLINKLFGRD